MNSFKSDSIEMESLISELNRKMDGKFDAHLSLIKQQRNRLERQEEQLSHQRAIIDELAWQIRDLRDSVRKCSEQSSNRKCKNCDECVTIHHAKLKHISQTNEQSNHVAETFAETPTDVFRSESNQRIKKNSLQRQDATDDTVQNRVCRRDVYSFLNNLIPPPPSETPPQQQDGTEYDQSPVQISSETFERLNSLYNSYGIRHSLINGTDDTEDVVRLRTFNKNYSARSYRGSSKAMCSYVSNVEDNYLPCTDDEDNESSHKFVEKSANSLNGNEDLQRKDKKSSTENEIVYI